MRNLDLDALAAFAAVARHKSFRRAAAAERVSASTLSETVKRLEETLGARLLNRTTRSVALTEAGARLLARLEPALAELDAAVDELHEQADVPAGTLRINAPVPAIDLVLAPLVARFLEAYPHIRLEVTAEVTLIDIVAEGYDAGVRWGEHLAQDMIAVPLGAPQRYQIVASPALIARHGRPSHPRELMELPCVRQKYPSGVMPEWEFERDGEVLLVDPPARLVSTTSTLQRRAALDGLGFCATFDGYVDEDIAAGRLVAVLEDWCAPFPGPFLYFPGNRNVAPALRAFIDFVRVHRQREA